MPTFIHGIAASENIDSSGERISIAGMDISSLEKDGVFNWEHKADQPGQVVGKVLKAKKIFSEQDCEDDHQLHFFQKCGVPYLYVMGELMDDYKDSAKEVAGMFRYDKDRENQNEKNVMNFSIEGAKINKQGMDILHSIARKVTVTVTPCNKAAVAAMVTPSKKAKPNIDELFKTESIEIELLEKSFFPKKPAAPVGAPPNLGTSIGMVGKLNVMSHAKPMHYPSASHQELKGIADLHFEAGHAAYKTGNRKVGDYHLNQNKWFSQAAERIDRRNKEVASATRPSVGPAVPAPEDKKLNKALDAGSGMAAPSQLVGGAALAKEDIKIPKSDFVQEHKHLINVLKNPTKQKLTDEAKDQSKELKQIKKNKWLVVAEESYKSWNKREQFETFMAKRMPHLTKGEIVAIGQVMALQKSLTLEKALSNMAKFENISDAIATNTPMEKGGGKDSIYTLILFEGCDLHDILHCSHFATDDVNDGTLAKIVEVCENYFKSSPAAQELKFQAEGNLGKEGQPVLFLTEGNPYKELWDELCKVAQYKYPKFRPHVSVTSNVDDFVGKASCIVISVNGQVTHKFNFSK